MAEEEDLPGFERKGEEVSPQVEDADVEADAGVENGRVERHHGVESDRTEGREGETRKRLSSVRFFISPSVSFFSAAAAIRSDQPSK